MLQQGRDAGRALDGGPTTYPCTTDAPGTTATCATTSTQLTSALLNGVTVIAAQ